MAKGNGRNGQDRGRKLRLIRGTGPRQSSRPVKLGFIEEKYLRSLCPVPNGVTVIDLSDFQIAPEVIQIVPGEVARRLQVLPVNRSGRTLVIAMADPTDIYAIDELKYQTGFDIEVVMASAESIRAAIDEYYG